MVYTTLLELYRIPELVPVEITILRGARRLRFSSSLRKKYSDFSPKIWNILAKLGYKKYLQKIYIGIEADFPLASPYYQLPIVIGILEATGMLQTNTSLYFTGKFLANYQLSLPKYTRGHQEVPQISTVAIQEAETIESLLHHLHTTPLPFSPPTFDLQEFFPGVIFQNGLISINKTPLPILKKIPQDTYTKQGFYLSYRARMVDPKKLSFLKELGKIRLTLSQKACSCELIPCICTETEKQLYKQQLHELHELTL